MNEPCNKAAAWRRDMDYVTLTRLIEKMKLENLTPEIEVKGIRIRQPDINRPALQMAGDRKSVV